MRVLEHFLASLMRDGQRQRDFLQATLEQAMLLRHDLLAMLITAQQPPEAERS